MAVGVSVATRLLFFVAWCLLPKRDFVAIFFV